MLGGTALRGALKTQLSTGKFAWWSYLHIPHVDAAVVEVCAEQHCSAVNMKRERPRPASHTAYLAYRQRMPTPATGSLNMQNSLCRHALSHHLAADAGNLAAQAQRTQAPPVDGVGQKEREEGGGAAAAHTH